MDTVLHPPRLTRRYEQVSDNKNKGETYTPSGFAGFLADRIIEASSIAGSQNDVSVFDPAAGDGELLLALTRRLLDRTGATVSVYAFDTNLRALDLARARMTAAAPGVKLHFEQGSFLDFVERQALGLESLFAKRHDFPSAFDFIIANPPYVRTQILGSRQTQQLASDFGLTGRVDLYHAFLLGIASVLKESGTAGVIVSNRFMTTKGGASVRAALRNRLDLKHVWDFGDTKLFDAAVLPAVIVANGLNQQHSPESLFSSIYETTDAHSAEAKNPLEAVLLSGSIRVPDGRCFKVQHGTLFRGNTDDAVWRIATDCSNKWLTTVAAHTWGTFRDIGKVRVGVKTCADQVFISNTWHTGSTDQEPELLRPLTTHHIARRFRAKAGERFSILYPHTSVAGKRGAVDLNAHPRSLAYLERHRSILEARTYVTEGGRRWYEIWVPQDPAAWTMPKLVFRDISKRPIFWLDFEGTVVNGDCYWLAPEQDGKEDLLWLAAAVANSTFTEAFYDHRFNNKLYAGRRRFITQYVEQFPLPEPTSDLAYAIIATAKELYENRECPDYARLETKLNELVWTAFGLRNKEV